MKARLLFYERRLFDDGAIIEMKIWRVPKPVPPSTDDLKYSLFYGYPGRRLVGYNNERTKGDHLHLDDRELPYTFLSVEQLMADSLADLRRARGTI